MEKRKDYARRDFRLKLFFRTKTNTQLDPAYSNSAISNSPLFRTQNHFPWIFPLLFPFYRLFRAPNTWNNFSFPLRVRNSGVQLYNLTGLSIWSSMSHLIHEIFADDVITERVKIIKKRHNLRKEDISDCYAQCVGIGTERSGFEPGCFYALCSLAIH